MSRKTPTEIESIAGEALLKLFPKGHLSDRPDFQSPNPADTGIIGVEIIEFIPFVLSESNNCSTSNPKTKPPSRLGRQKRTESCVKKIQDKVWKISRSTHSKQDCEFFCRFTINNAKVFCSDPAIEDIASAASYALAKQKIKKMNPCNKCKLIRLSPPTTYSSNIGITDAELLSKSETNVQEAMRLWIEHEVEGKKQKAKGYQKTEELHLLIVDDHYWFINDLRHSWEMAFKAYLLKTGSDIRPFKSVMLLRFVGLGKPPSIETIL